MPQEPVKEVLDLLVKEGTSPIPENASPFWNIVFGPPSWPKNQRHLPMKLQRPCCTTLDACSIARVKARPSATGAVPVGTSQATISAGGLAIPSLSPSGCKPQRSATFAPPSPVTFHSYPSLPQSCLRCRAVACPRLTLKFF